MTRPVTRQAAAENREKEKKERQKLKAEQQKGVSKGKGNATERSVEAVPRPLEERGVGAGSAEGEQGPKRVSSRTKDSEKTVTLPPAAEIKKTNNRKPPTSGKRPRPPSISPPARVEKRRRKKRDEPKRGGLRPGVPAPVNPRSFIRTDRPSGPDRGDNKDGHYEYGLGESITSRYKILSKMGEGTFGRVFECWDRKNKRYVAIKIVRSLPKYRDAAMQELEVLNTLIANDPEEQNHWVRMLEWFDYRRHVCIVFEKLGLSLYDFLRRNSYIAFHIELVRQFGRQLLHNVAYLHDLNLVHTDLKPENIMLKNAEYDKYEMPSRRRKVVVRVPRSSAIKVIDFGSTIFEDKHHSTTVCTRHYRAPEVILGLGWSFPVDIWSVGCILVELATGYALFQTHDNAEHLAMMQQVLGPIPESVAALAIRKAKSTYFKRNRLRWPLLAEDKGSIAAVKELASLRKMLLNEGHPSVQDWLDDLVDLIKQMMRYEPSARIQASQALQHPFFQVSTNESNLLRKSVEDRPRTRSSDVIVLE